LINLNKWSLFRQGLSRLDSQLNSQHTYGIRDASDCSS